MKLGRIVILASLGLIFLPVMNSAWAGRSVTDLVGRQIEIPDMVERIAIIPIPWATIIYAVDGRGDRITGMHPSAMAAYENSILKTMAPELGQANRSFVDNDFNVNYEELIGLNPDLVIIWDYQPVIMEKLKQLGIASVAIKYGTLEDVQNGIRLVGSILDKPAAAEALIEYHQSSDKYFAAKRKTLERREKPRVLYLRDDQLTVAGGSSVNRLMIETVGGQNVTNEIGAQWSKVTMEQIMAWDPEIIVISNFSELLPEAIYAGGRSGQDWSGLSAVRNKRVYKAPMGIYRWDAPCVETPLMIRWLAKVISPNVFNDYDLRKELTDFYQKYFNYGLNSEQVEQILKSGLNPDLKL